MVRIGEVHSEVVVGDSHAGDERERRETGIELRIEELREPVRQLIREELERVLRQEIDR